MPVGLFPMSIILQRKGPHEAQKVTHLPHGWHIYPWQTHRRGQQLIMVFSKTQTNRGKQNCSGFEELLVEFEPGIFRLSVTCCTHSLQCLTTPRKCPFAKKKRACSHRRTGQHPFGGSNRVLPEWRTQIVCHAAPPGREK